MVEFLKIITNTPHITYLDEASEMIAFAKELSPLNRPLMGLDIRAPRKIDVALDRGSV